ncbi:MAG: Omp28-related outer membrane protein [Bacteroidetes bacterium]|nr:Omp28-related outer membrane protein [Bacteroidota bacterium]
MTRKHSILLSVLLLMFTSGVAQTKRVLIEEFTGAECGNCPPQSYAMLTWVQQHSTNNILYCIHEGFIPDNMSSPFTNEILVEFASPFGTFNPAVMIDRTRFPWLGSEPFINVDGFDSVATRIYTTEPPKVDVNIQGTYNSSTRQINATVNTTFLQNIPAGDYRINLYLVEDSVIGNGMGWDQRCYDSTFAATHYPGQYNSATHYIVGYPHRHVLRSSLTGTWGTAGIIPNTPVLNTPYSTNLTYNVPANYNDQRIYLVAFVSHYASNPAPLDSGNGNCWVLNANDAKLGSTFLSPNGINSQSISNSAAIELFPNPASDQLTLMMSVNAQLDGEFLLINSLGQTVKQLTSKTTYQTGIYQLNVNLSELPAGIYFAALKTEQGIVVKKFARN